MFVAQTCVPLSRDQEEWSAVEWFLQMTYRSSCVTVRALWTVSHPSLSHQFMRRANGKQVVRAVTLSDDLPVATRQICERGVHQPFKVVIGNQLLPGATVEPNPATGFAVRKRSAGRRVYEAVVFQVAVGIAQSVSSESPNPRDIPTDYDAYLLEAKEEPLLAAVEDGKVVFLAPSTFQQVYLLKEGAQTLPEFLVHFEVDDDKQEDFCLPPCAICERAAATVWCVADDAGLCGHCDSVEHHEDNKIASRHQRVPINERLIGLPATTRCVLVPSESASLWDVSLGLALSQKAVQEALLKTEGPLVEFGLAYKTGVKAARREDTFTASLKKQLMAEVQTLNDELRSVIREKEEADIRINSVVDAAVNRAADIAKDKSSNLLSSQERVTQQLEFIQWVMTVLVPFTDRLSPAEWLRLWTNLNQLVKQRVEADGVDAAEDTAEDSANPFLIHLQANLRVNSN